MPKPIDLVVLDMAGTTIRDDDAVNRCLQAALGAYGIASSRDEVNQVMGLPKPVAIQGLLERKAGGQAKAETVKRIHDNFLARMVCHYREGSGVEPMPFAVEVISELRENGVKVFLDTGFSSPIVDAILQRVGWDDGTVLDGVVSSDEVFRGRPHPDMILRAMQLGQVEDSGAVAKVGDTPSDLHEGAAAGCGLVIGVTSGSHTREELLPHPHTHLLPNLKPLAGLILSTRLRLVT